MKSVKGLGYKQVSVCNYVFNLCYYLRFLQVIKVLVQNITVKYSLMVYIPENVTENTMFP